MNIYVCVGSSCHLKGSYEIISALKEEITAANVQDQVNLQASFCLGRCQDGATIKIDDEIVTGVTPQNVRGTFREKVLKELSAQ